MLSPVANHKTMPRVSLDDGLTAYQCTETDGIFLPVASYFRWLSKRPERLVHLPKSNTEPELASVDSTQAKICPESGQLMQRYRVGHGFSFYLDRSPLGSIWFDKGEWEQLKARQFHDELHLIFTAPWQEEVRHEQRLQTEREILEERLGSELLKELDTLKNKLKNKKYREMALAYLHE